MKIATCTPVNFKADTHFFGRDSGLLCRGFHAIGIDCVSIMPGARAADDATDLLRTSPENLTSVSWWRSLELDIVVLYAWGNPSYRSIARAIRGAGIKLVQNLDTAGLVTPYGNLTEWLDCSVSVAAMPQPLSQRLRRIAKAMRDTVPAIYEKKRLEMIDESDLVTVVSPPALQSIVRYANALGFPQIAEKIAVAPHPVPPMMTYGGDVKQNKVLCVGRWEADDAAQKDPNKLLAVLKSFLTANPYWSAEVVGRGSESLRGLCSGWAVGALDRLVLTPATSREELLEKYLASKIHLCPSRFESYHIASAEAICCGSSVVVGNHPLLASTAWFTTRESGKIAADRSTAALMAALTDEAVAWEQGKRDAMRISASWQTSLHANHVASAILTEIWHS